MIHVVRYRAQPRLCTNVKISHGIASLQARERRRKKEIERKGRTHVCVVPFPFFFLPLTLRYAFVTRLILGNAGLTGDSRIFRG